MLAILAQWFYIGCISFVLGHSIISVLHFFLKGKYRLKEELHISLYILTGLIGASSYAFIYHLYGPLNLASNIPLLVFTAGYIFLNKSALRHTLRIYLNELKELRSINFIKKIPLLILFCSSLVLILTSSCSPAYYYDDGLYYQQYILWLDSFPVIPGLGNIHPRLAYNSSWHHLCSLFNFSELFSTPLNNLNGFLHFTIVIYALHGLTKLFKGNLALSNYLKISLLIPTHLFEGFLSAPSPDLPVIYTIWFAAIVWFEHSRSAKSVRNDIALFLILSFSLFAITLKLTALSVFFFLGVVILSNRKHLTRKKISVFIILAFVILTPWEISNWFQSGYLAFPIHQIDLFNPSWKIPGVITQEESIYIQAFAWGRELITTFPYYSIQNLNLLEKIQAWLNSLRLSSQILLLLNIGTFLVCIKSLVHFVFKRNNMNISGNSNPIPIILFYLSGILSWVFIAPDFRFGYAFLAGSYAVLFGWLFYKISQVKARSSFSLFIFILLIALLYSKPIISSTSNYICMVNSTSSYFLLTPGTAFDQPNEFRTQGNHRIYMPLCNDQCWNSLLPCSPYPDIGFELKNEDAGVIGGFINQQPNINAYRKWLLYYQPYGAKEQLNSNCFYPCK